MIHSFFIVRFWFWNLTKKNPGEKFLALEEYLSEIKIFNSQIAKAWFSANPYMDDADDPIPEAKANEKVVAY